MNKSKRVPWLEFQKYYAEFPSLGLAPEVSRKNLAQGFVTLEPCIQMNYYGKRGRDVIDNVVVVIGEHLGQTLWLTITKSGCTKEYGSRILEAEAPDYRVGVDFDFQAIPVQASTVNMTTILSYISEPADRPIGMGIYNNRTTMADGAMGVRIPSD